MKTALATLLSMVVGWAVPILGLAIMQLIFDGRTTDVAVMAWWTGLFAFAGWVTGVLPLMSRLKKWKAFSSVRYAWLGWSVLGMVAYAVLTIPWAAWNLWVIIWYPGLVGAIAGFTFSLICRRPSGAHGT